MRSSALLKEGADANVASEGGWTAFMFAVKKGHYKCVLLLIKARANLRAAQSNGDTALTLAAEEGHKQIRTLIETMLRQN